MEPGVIRYPASIISHEDSCTLRYASLTSCRSRSYHNQPPTYGSDDSLTTIDLPLTIIVPFISLLMTSTITALFFVLCVTFTSFKCLPLITRLMQKIIRGIIKLTISLQDCKNLKSLCISYLQLF